jgi:MSHA biogenesis protein MshP
MNSANRTPLGLYQGAESRQAGFTLITALFLLVVVAGLSVYMITIRNVQQSTVVFAQQGARAMQAANAGLEWGIYQALRNSSGIPCDDAVDPLFTATGTALSAFNITVGCSFTEHTEASTLIYTYELTSTAETGNYGTLDYVYRSLRATVSIQPP